LLAGMRGAFKQERTYRRAQALFVAELLVLGRHTITQLLRGLGLVTHDWSAWYRLFSEARFEEEAVAAVEARVPGAAARELEADPAVAEVRVREEEVRDNEDMHSHHGRGRHGGGHLPALRQGSYFYHCRYG